MSKRSFSVVPGSRITGQPITNADDRFAVVVVTGQAFLHMSIADARRVSEDLARTADDVEIELAKRGKS